MLYHLLLSGIFCFLLGGGRGLNVSPGFFLGGGGGVLSPRVFLGFHFCPHSIIPVT